MMRQEEKLKDIVNPLLQWFQANKRDLPWRHDPTPYRVWVSEIMLQQTRVEAVKPYYQRFMQKLPDVEHLAEASEAELLKLWEGLGYYSRVRNMQKAAIQVLEEYEGCIPTTYNELCKLKGIGSYTAGAIASIACGQREPAVDGNVLRVITRILADESLITKQSVKREAEAAIRRIMPKEHPGDLNQALMELGAMICLPNGEPLCHQCPVARFCSAREQGNMTEYPHKESKKPRKIEEKTILIIQDDEKTALRKRPARGLLAGFYEFPMMDCYVNQDEALAYVSNLGFSPLRILPLENARHIFTHKEWLMKAYVVKIEAAMEYEKNLIFADQKEAEEKYPLPSAFSVYTKYLNIRIGNEKFMK